MTSAIPGPANDTHSNGDGEGEGEGHDDVSLMVNVEHPYQRIARVCRPVVERMWCSMKQSPPMTVLAWAAAIASGLQFSAQAVSFTFVGDRFVWLGQLSSAVPLLLVIAAALARPTHRLALLSVRIAAFVLWGAAAVSVLWTATRFFQPDPEFESGAGYLFPLYAMNFLLVPTALCVLLFRRSSSSISSSVTKPRKKTSS